MVTCPAGAHRFLLRLSRAMTGFSVQQCLRSLHSECVSLPMVSPSRVERMVPSWRVRSRQSDTAPRRRSALLAPAPFLCVSSRPLPLLVVYLWRVPFCHCSKMREKTDCYRITIASAHNHQFQFHLVLCYEY